MRNAFFAGILLAGSVVAPRPGTGQEIVVTVQAPGGWIGITLEFASATVGGRDQPVALIQAVTAGSPADRSGVRVGDTLTHIDGDPASARTLDLLRQSLDPGDMVRLRILRDGRSRELLVEAAPWPGDPEVLVLNRTKGQSIPGFQEVVVRLDSVRGAILQNLDSMAITIRHTGYDTVPGARWSFFRPGGGDEGRAVWTMHFDSLHFSPEVYFMGPEAAFPFETFETLVVRSPATDSIRSSLERVSRELSELRRSEAARMRELGSAGGSEEAFQRDARIREIRAREESLRGDQQRLQERLQRVSEEEMKRRWAESQLRAQEAWELTRERARTGEGIRSGRADSLRLIQERRLREMEEEVFTPQRILAVGQTFMLGAQLQTLNRELAEYFPVDRGLLVTQVVEKTPAAEAGLRGGDIIVAAGGEPVSSMEDFRLLLGYARSPLSLEVVRKGERLVLEIRR